MIKQREGHTFLVHTEAQERIKQNQCANCGKPKAKWTRRKDWTCCSKECTTKYLSDWVLVKSWSDLREKVFKRDNYTCVHCKQRPLVIASEIDRSNPDTNKWFFYKKTFTQEDPKYFYLLSSELIGDHIKAIALGGEEWDINNIQTLCKPCNKIKTANDSKLIAELRKQDRNYSQGIKKIGEFL